MVLDVCTTEWIREMDVDCELELELEWYELICTGVLSNWRVDV